MCLSAWCVAAGGRAAACPVAAPWHEAMTRMISRKMRAALVSRYFRSGDGSVQQLAATGRIPLQTNSAFLGSRHTSVWAMRSKSSPPVQSSMTMKTYHWLSKVAWRASGAPPPVRRQAHGRRVGPGRAEQPVLRVAEPHFDLDAVLHAEEGVHDHHLAPGMEGDGVGQLGLHGWHGATRFLQQFRFGVKAQASLT